MHSRRARVSPTPETNPDQVVIFEPWGLGDLCVALCAARTLGANSIPVTMVCNPAWADWVRTLSFVSNVIPFYAPWTAKEGKYHPSKYKLSALSDLRASLKVHRGGAIVDLRCDLRHQLFFYLVWNGRQIKLPKKPFANRYDRPDALCEKLGLSSHQPPGRRDPNDSIVVNFFAGWENREVPFIKACDIVSMLQSETSKVIVLCPPGVDTSKWEPLKRRFPGKIEFAQESMAVVAQLIASSKLCVSTDSGPMHLAHFLGVPSIGLFGFSNYDEWLPPSSVLVTSDTVLPKDARYVRAEDKQPLETLNVEKLQAAVRKVLSLGKS